MELKAEKKNAHTSGLCGSISSVQFSPDGTQVVSAGITDKTIKVWDAVNVRPYDKAEWEEIDEGTDKYDQSGALVRLKWHNKSTGHKQTEKPSGVGAQITAHVHV